MYEWVTKHNANANDDIHACVTLHDTNVNDNIYACVAFHNAHTCNATTSTERRAHFLGSVVVSSSSHTYAPWLKMFAPFTSSTRSSTCVWSLRLDPPFLLLALPSALFLFLNYMKSVVNLHNCCNEGVDASDDLLLSTCSIMHIDVSRAYFHAKAQNPVLIRLLVEDRMGTDAGKVGLMKKSMYGTRDAASNWERDWQEHGKNWGFQLGLSSKNLFHHKENRVSGLIHGDDFVLTGPTKKLMRFERKMTSVYPIKAKIIGYGSPKSIKTLNRRLHR